MESWLPVTAEELEALLAVQLVNCTPEQQRFFDRCKATPYLAPIQRFGNTEAVFVVAESGDRVLYYEDVEDGFNISPLARDGSIAVPGWEQWKLSHALQHFGAA